MHTLKELFRIGKGPSSSHTIGPERACELFRKENPNADAFKVILYGSLAKTGVGHGTDEVIKETLPNVCVCFDETEQDILHPNTMDLFAFEKGAEIGFMRVYSVGGGAIRIDGRTEKKTDENVYLLNSFDEIREYCKKEKKRLCEYVFESEGEEIKGYLSEVWEAMRSAVVRGVGKSGVLPGGLGVERKAKVLFEQNGEDNVATHENRLVCAYAFAVGEENASGGTIVTAPTCGACGVLPAVLKYAQEKNGYTDEQIVSALATAGLIGNLIKTNASISGAECGCQAEIGSACCMAAAALGELQGMSLDQIEYAAENAMEHYLGLTCDPICGLVQIPCIERNAVAAMRAINAVSLAEFLSGSRKISFDLVVQTMYETGKDLHRRYRETAEGGLAKLYKK